MTIIIFSLLLITVLGHYNQAISFMIGDSGPSGGVNLYNDFQIDPLDLSTECGSKECPTVLIFSGDQQKTVNIVNCKIGQMYFFINRSKHDMGLDIQQLGGLFGSKSMSRFDVATCACLENYNDEEKRMTGGALFCR